MSGMRKRQRDHAAQEERRPPFDFAQSKPRYVRQTRRRRNRRYGLIGALLILSVGTGIVLVLVANWLYTLAK
jgi:hypothetical protein